MKKFFYIIFLSLSMATGTTGYSQGLIERNPDQIVLNISDTVINNTVIKRKAELFTMTYNLKNQFVSLTWVVKHYSDSLVIENGKDSSYYGQYLGGLIPDKIKETIADTTVYVNAMTGDFVYPDSSGNLPTNIPIYRQYTYFNYGAGHVPMIVHDLIKQYGDKADWNYNLK